MTKTWLVAAATYRRSVRSGMFLILTFGLPTLMIIAGAVPILREVRGGDQSARIGYVDMTGHLVAVPRISTPDITIDLRQFASADQARSAHQIGEIDGFLLIPEDYFENYSGMFFGDEEPTSAIESALELFVRQATLGDRPAWALARLTNPTRATLVSDNTGEAIEEGPAVVSRLATPVVLYILFALAVFTGVSQIGSAVVREKDQRAMEMIITSLSPRELVTGKVLGMALVSLTQLGVWAVGGGLAAALALSGTIALSDLSIPARPVVWAILLGLPGYLLFSMTAAGLGIIAGDQQQAQQLAGMLGFLGLAPLWLLGSIVEAPDGALALSLSLFPFTSPMLSMLRMTLTNVPTWQLASALALILLALGACTWSVARVFRTAMLMYGQTLRPRQIFNALRQT